MIMENHNNVVFKKLSHELILYARGKKSRKMYQNGKPEVSTWLVRLKINFIFFFTPFSIFTISILSMSSFFLLLSFK